MGGDGESAAVKSVSCVELKAIPPKEKIASRQMEFRWIHLEAKARARAQKRLVRYTSSEASYVKESSDESAMDKVGAVSADGVS